MRRRGSPFRDTLGRHRWPSHLRRRAGEARMFGAQCEPHGSLLQVSQAAKSGGALAPDLDVTGIGAGGIIPTTVKTAVLAPMPIAKVRNAVAANPGLLRRVRAA